MKDQPIRVALLDNYQLELHGLRLIINSFPGCSVTIEAGTGEELLQKLAAASTPPDICLIDLSMPGRNDLGVLATLRNTWPSLKVIVLSIYNADYIILQTMRLGARAYLCKSEDTSTHLQAALGAVHAQGFYLNSCVDYRTFMAVRENGRNIPRITPPEMTFMKLCCSERSYDDMAKIMFVSKRTIDGYRDSLFRKLDLTTRTALCIFAIHNGLVALEELNYNIAV